MAGRAAAGRTFSIEIRQAWCKGCYICLQICPKQVFDRHDDVSRAGFRRIRASRPDLCTGCLLCELMCPDVAIRVEETDEIPRDAKS